MDKLTIKNVPLTVSNGSIKTMLEENNVELISELKYGYLRDKEGNMSNYKSGERYVWVKPFDPPIQRAQRVDGYRAIIVHHGKDNRVCKACNNIGHQVGAESCPAKPTEKIHAFRGYQNPLSNHYPFQLDVWDMTFGSVEHAYFWRMASDMKKPNIANQIHNAKHAGIAKNLSKQIASEDGRITWEMSVGIGVMKDLLYEKTRQCPEFIETIYYYRDHVFAEATPSKIWASGLSEFVTVNTSQKNWPGENRLGEMINDIAKNIDKILRDIQDGKSEEIIQDLGLEENAYDWDDESWVDCVPHTDDERLKDEIATRDGHESYHDDLEEEWDYDEIPKNTSSIQNDCDNDVDHTKEEDANDKQDAELINKLTDKNTTIERPGRPRIKHPAIAQCLDRPRSHSIQRDRDIESFMYYLDETCKEMKETEKRKELASSPDKTCSPDKKCPKVS